MDDSMDDGRPEKLGLSLGCNVGQSEIEGCSEGWPLGILDNEGFMDGLVLGWYDGWDVGQSETEGFIECWLLGAVLIDGGPDGIDVGQSVTDGASLGFELG
mmetsp:Transcript_14857/g.32266  ORF Transcript_14857/g.32266 Transcript_14857/m.32266 type:complete len:101 (+) Transcript_14857:506-808(+)